MPFDGTVRIDPDAVTVGAASAADAAETLDGFGDLAVLSGPDDAGTWGVADAYGSVAGDWPVRRSRLSEDLRTLSAFASAAVRAMTALDGQLVTVDVPRA